MPKRWTAEEQEYLKEAWGRASIPAIAKKLGRTVDAVKVRASKLKLGAVLEAGDYVTLNQLLLTLTDNSQSYSYQMESGVNSQNSSR